MSSAEQAELKSGRDVRIDTMGFAGELEKLFIKDLKTTVKVKMTGGGFDQLSGDCFQGKLAQTVDPVKFFKLFEKGLVTRKDFLSAISVSSSAAKLFLSPKDLQAITDTTPGSPRLSIERIEGVGVGLVQALEGIRAAAAAKE